MRGCRIIAADSPEGRTFAADFEVRMAEPCRRCTHPFRDHPNSNAVACTVDGCDCHCFWEQPAAG